MKEIKSQMKEMKSDMTEVRRQREAMKGVFIWMDRLEGSRHGLEKK